MGSVAAKALALMMEPGGATEPEARGLGLPKKSLARISNRLRKVGDFRIICIPKRFMGIPITVYAHLPDGQNTRERMEEVFAARGIQPGRTYPDLLEEEENEPTT
jgi:hypothetical protein